ncbi:glycoside hydrolase family 3 N-terminal domain-containing protein [Camelimonas lactis]|uniref:beta-glucosidase n=1 Tax=Camelimonas lactis TaxID=659006 RepID=A0A4R2H0Z2_9HYPH|nr:glycoside hydrolase family 3 N-terminal domain-containing protein [Camelimonas lactis]TCO16273.1 beta-glucosidase [Camelimonas lactis]
MPHKPGRSASPLAGLAPEDILTRMTLDEKIGQLHMVSADAVITGPSGPPGGLRDLDQGRIGSVLNVWGDAAAGLQRKAVEQTRLGLPLLFCLDVVHGFRTVFPIPLAEAASFSDGIWRETAAAAAREAAEAGVALTFAPMADVSRDPRWGRICEGGGEDPLVNARMAQAKIAGFQGDDLRDEARLAATVKHFAAYGAGVGGREYDSADVSDYAMAADYLPPFRAAVAAGVAALMPAFLDIAGAPMTANRALLTDVLRKTWGFGGVTITDYNAVAELIAHGAAEDGLAAATLAFNAGNDVDMVSGLYHRHLAEAAALGLVALADIDAAALRVLRLKQALGLFENPWRVCPPATPVQVASRREAARRAARESLTLLRDPQGALPLPRQLARLAVIGALATSAADMRGAWAETGDVEAIVTIADGVRAAWPQADVAVCGDDPQEAAAAARAAGVAILCLGETAAMSGEAAARANPVLPDGQQALLDAVLATGARVIVLLACGRPLVAPQLFVADCAVLVIWGLGSEAGRAIADVLSGDASPSGRLPVSWPRAIGQIPVFYARRPTGRPHEAGARYSNGYADLPIAPQFPFGHGLGYATFSWSDLQVSAMDRAGATSPLTISLAVRHETGAGGWPQDGRTAAIETVFLFARVRVPGRTRPLLLLRDFTRVALRPGETRRVSFEVSRDWLTREGLAPAPAAVSFLEIIVAASAEPEVDPARCLRRVLVAQKGAEHGRAAG